jgi:two-component system LytT family response regulator
MRVIIVDDEELARGVLREYLRAHADVEVVAECANGFEAVKAIAELEPDVVFLDIQMPKLDGFEVVELAGAKPHYVFATAYDQYALKAFEVHAIDYLLKPYPQERLDQAVAHVRKRLGGDRPAVAQMAAERIDSIEAQDDYVEILAEGKPYLKNQRLSELEQQLDQSRFVRLHRSWIVNVERIARIEQSTKDSHCAVLKDGRKIPVSRTGYQKVRGL